MSEDHHDISANPRDWPKTLFYVALLFRFSDRHGSVFALFEPGIACDTRRFPAVGGLPQLSGLWQQTPLAPLARILSLAAIATALYQWRYEADLIQRPGI